MFFRTHFSFQFYSNNEYRRRIEPCSIQNLEPSFSNRRIERGIAATRGVFQTKIKKREREKHNKEVNKVNVSNTFRNGSEME